MTVRFIHVSSKSALWLRGPESTPVKHWENISPSWGSGISKELQWFLPDPFLCVNLPYHPYKPSWVSKDQQDKEESFQDHDNQRADFIFHYLWTIYKKYYTRIINKHWINYKIWHKDGWHFLTTKKLHCVLSHISHVRLSATPWTMACQAPLSMGLPGKNTEEPRPTALPWLWNKFNLNSATGWGNRLHLEKLDSTFAFAFCDMLCFLPLSSLLTLKYKPMWF